MSTPTYAFKRYYAEAEFPHKANSSWIVKGEDQPGNAQYVGFTYRDEANAKWQADRLNQEQETDFDAHTNKFTDEAKQLDFEEHMNFRDMLNKMELRKTTTKILKSRNEENEQEDTESSMETYPEWGSFGTRSTKKNSSQTYAINIDDTGTIKGFGLNYDDEGNWIPNDDR